MNHHHHAPQPKTEHHHSDGDSGPQPSRAGSREAFRWAILLNSSLTGLQIVIGMAFGSVALIGDAVHNLGDVLGLLLGWGAEGLSRLSPSGRYTYGFGRSSQLAALINGILILMAAAVVCVESIQRFGRPVEIHPGPVAWAAAAGLAVNLISAGLFGNDHHHDLNRRGAVMHLLSDAAVSAAVLLSALIIQITGWSWVDALTGVGVGITVGWMGVDLIREALAESLDGIPSRINIESVLAELKQLPDVSDVHHLHIWGISTSKVALTAHLVRPVDAAGQDPDLLNQAQLAMAKLGIAHTTIQLETNREDHSSSCELNSKSSDG
ncbi:MAG: cation diffusion facilitator family transporter [Prochlorococcus sp.]